MPRKRLYGKEKLVMFSIAIPPSMKKSIFEIAYAEHTDASSWTRQKIQEAIDRARNGGSKQE